MPAQMWGYALVDKVNVSVKKNAFVALMEHLFPNNSGTSITLSDLTLDKCFVEGRSKNLQG